MIVCPPFIDYELYVLQAQILGYSKEQAEMWAISECEVAPPDNYRDLYKELFR